MTAENAAAADDETWRRPPHEQRITSIPEPRRFELSSTQFIGYVSGIKNGRLGGMKVEIEIPADFLHQATPLLSLVGEALSIDVQPWEIAKEENV